jgi:hypothetical protein
MIKNVLHGGAAISFLLTLYIFGFTTLAWLDVGEPIQCQKRVYEWTLPLFIFWLLTIPSILGYVLGRLTEKYKSGSVR